MKNKNMDGHIYANVSAFKPSPRDGIVASVKFACTHANKHTHTNTHTNKLHTQYIKHLILPSSTRAIFVPILDEIVKHITKNLILMICDTVHFQWWKRPPVVAAVCLGLLCVLLLAGVIGLSVYYGVFGHHVSTERDQQASYSLLIKERDQLRTSYNNLTKERDQLQTCNNNLTKERDQLQTLYNTLTKERAQLQADRDPLSNWSWQKFESSWYFLSTETKTWEESREDCLKRGADLVIINSDKEQEFLFNLKKRVWIGLTDSVTEATWIWVDGTTLTTGYWYNPQPDNAGPTGEEDCVEIQQDQRPLKAWNDLSCDSKLNWICEKVV
uniref:CD209 antigen-like protein E n=1 Tax=Salmo trutta TaxID=8032 RepID=A0A673Y8W3_SALTR